MNIKKRWTHWFEIPVLNFERALEFYQNIFEIKIQINDFGALKMGIFPFEDVGCAICEHEAYVPSKEGVLIFLDGSPDLQVVQGKIEKAGGKVLIEKRQISPEQGFMAVFIDTEGNRLGLRSLN